MESTLIIMAAGMGSRYGGIKQIDPMGPNGEIILDYSVYDAVQAGFSRVLFIIRKDIESVFRDRIGARFENKIDVEYAFQDLSDVPGGFAAPETREKPWGTAHAVMACRHMVKEPFVVINADDFYGSAAFVKGMEGLGSLDADSLDGFLVAYRLENTLSPHGYVTRGVCKESDGRLVRVTECFRIGKNESGFIEHRDESGSHPMSGREPVSMNFWGFTPALFPVLENRFEDFLAEKGAELKSEYLIPSEVDSLIDSGRMTISVLQTDADWFGVTYPDDKPAVKKSLAKLIQDGVYPSPLWK